METSLMSLWRLENFNNLLHDLERIRQYLQNTLEGKEQPPLEPKPFSPSYTLDVLCQRFALSSFERDVLLLCLGFEIEPAFAELFAKVHGDAQKNYPTLAFCLSSLPEASWSVLSPLSPLQSWQLIELSASYPASLSRITLDQRILCYLLGEDADDQKLAGIVSTVPRAIATLVLSPSQEQIVEQLVASFTESSPDTCVLQLSGGELSANYRMALEIATRLGYSLQVISADSLPSEPQELLTIKQRWEREAWLTSSFLLVDCDHLSDNESSSVSMFVENLRTPVLLSGRERLKTKLYPVHCFDVPPLSSQEQRVIWSTHLGAYSNPLNGHLDRLASQFNLSSSSIQAASDRYKTAASVADNGQTPANPNLLWDYCRRQARPRLDDLAQRLNSTAVWDDLVIPEQQRQILVDIATHLKHRAKVYQDWGFADKGSRGLGISALFYGASGTGKTMAAEVLANLFHLDLYRIDLSAVVSKYIGETEKNLQRIFDAAETGGAILLFDEADAIFGKRTEVKDSHDRYANVEISYLLQRMEAYQGLAILTSNRKEDIDTAFMRRIRFVVQFPLPDAASRSEIWQRIFPPQTPTQGLDYQKLGQLNLPGGNIRNIALNAAFLAADADEPVMMKHLLQGAQRECFKLKRLLSDEETRGWT
ncbi:MAG: AAA family ATPase [Coleofasciculus sp. D1-CHI-01]|uniref:ATP-binding protein n=1 Tax=Coleofasciculus sp. D1-CHI-01 TaxID=3068482 RepID=UPI0032FADD57